MKLSQLMARMSKTNIRAKAESSTRRLLEFQRSVYAKENDLIEIRRQMDILTPRAIAKGWKAELGENELGAAQLSSV